MVEWKVIADAADARAFADQLIDAPRSFVGRTAIGSAIDFSLARFAESGFQCADRSVIDVSGDGTSNQGRIRHRRARRRGRRRRDDQRPLDLQQRAAAEGGYFALHTNPPGGIDKYYRDNVIGGIGAFVLRIDDFNSFEQAMIQKLVTEISRVPPEERARRADESPRISSRARRDLRERSFAPPRGRPRGRAE